MDRVADYTIKGFIYQFNKTLLEILLDTDNSTITVEGVIEDIDIETPLGIDAIQCKYHGAQTKFKLSIIYKPLLQMMHHFHVSGNGVLRYKLYAYFPGESGNRNLTIEELTTAIESSDKNLINLTRDLKGKINLDNFLRCFSFEFGKSLDELEKDIHKALIKNGMPIGEIEALIYPNAINEIAQLSIKHDEPSRRIKKVELLKRLKDIRKTAITRWTIGLKSFDKLMKERRKQLKECLGKNTRLRYFIICKDQLKDFNAEIVTFIEEVLDKYHFKPAHIRTPLFCLDCSSEEFSDIRIRLYRKGIRVADGFIGTDFIEEEFYREPVIRYLTGRIMQTEFRLRYLQCSDIASTLLNKIKCDDLFLVGSDKMNFDVQDVNVEKLDVDNLIKLKFLLGVADVYER